MGDRYWVGGTGYWNDTAHWSTTSGGSGGASVPADGDNVFIDANSGSGDFTIYINTNTANLYQCRITYPYASGVLTIVQSYNSAQDKNYTFNCYYGTLSGDYKHGGLISGTSTSNYSRVLWKKGTNGKTTEMHLTRFELWGKNASGDDGFTLVSGGNNDPFDVHVYGTYIIKASRSWSYKMNLHIHTPKTVMNDHYVDYGDNSGTWYGCDCSYSPWTISVCKLYIYDNAKLVCDLYAHANYCPSRYGIYINALDGTTSDPIIIYGTGELDIGINYEVGRNGWVLNPLPVYPRFCRFQGESLIYVNGDIKVQGTYASYMSTTGPYASVLAYIDMQGHDLYAPKVLVGPASIDTNDIAPNRNFPYGSMLRNVGTIYANNIIVVDSSSTNSYSKIYNVNNITDYNNTGTGATITLYSGSAVGGILDLTNTTSAVLNTLDMSDTTYSQPSQFYAPTTGTWVQKGNINFGSKARFFNNGGTMTLGNNITFTNTSTNSHFNKINFGNYVLTVNNKLEFYGSNVYDTNLNIASGAWAICKHPFNETGRYYVWGTLNWSTPQSYPLISSLNPANGIILTICLPSTGSTLFTFNVDNTGLKYINVNTGTQYRVATGVDVYCMDMIDNGTRVSGSGYYGYIWVDGIPLYSKLLDKRIIFDMTPLDYASELL